MDGCVTKLWQTDWMAMYTNESMRQLCFRQLFDVAHSMAMAPARHGDFKMLRNNTIPFKHLGTTMAGKTVQP